jgi:hypothetical protein
MCQGKDVLGIGDELHRMHHWTAIIAGDLVRQGILNRSIWFRVISKM